jgi:hypothetical protein
MMGRAIVLTLLVTAAVAASASAARQAQPELRSASFRTPSTNIACRSYRFGGRTFLRCDIRSGLRPQPRRRCQLDWTGLQLSSRDRATPSCAGDTVYHARAPILRYGRRWSRGGISCVSRTTGLTCRNRSGRGFVLARERWRLF